MVIMTRGRTISTQRLLDCMNKWAKLNLPVTLTVQEYHLTSIANMFKTRHYSNHPTVNFLKWANLGKDFSITFRNTKNIWESAHLRISTFLPLPALFNLNTHKINKKDIYYSCNKTKERRKLLMILLEKKQIRRFSILMNLQQLIIKDFKINQIHDIIWWEKVSLRWHLLLEVKLRARKDILLFKIQEWDSVILTLHKTLKKTWMKLTIFHSSKNKQIKKVSDKEIKTHGQNITHQMNQVK